LRMNRRGIAIAPSVKRPGRHFGRGICVVPQPLTVF
jgi:hypothetical protein